jgi:hypothetical protein
MIIHSYFFNINNIFLIEDAIIIILEPILCLEYESEDFQLYLVFFHLSQYLYFYFFTIKDKIMEFIKTPSI